MRIYGKFEGIDCKKTDDKREMIFSIRLDKCKLSDTKELINLLQRGVVVELEYDPYSEYNG